MKKLPTTKRECIRLHREMWDWLAKNPLAEKLEWPGWVGKEEYAMNRCFLCHYAMVLKSAWCEMCPAEGLWTCRSNVETPCCSVGSPYRNWREARDLRYKELAAKYAAQVRDIMKRGKK